MNIFKKMKINKYAFGSINVKWQIQKDLMKEKFNIDWKSPQDENPYTKFD